MALAGQAKTRGEALGEVRREARRKCEGSTWWLALTCVRVRREESARRIGASDRWVRVYKGSRTTVANKVALAEARQSFVGAAFV